MNEKVEGYSTSYQGRILVPNDVRRAQELRFIKTQPSSSPEADFELEDDLLEPVPPTLAERLAGRERLVHEKEPFYRSTAERLLKEIIESIDEGDESVKAALLSRYSVTSYAAAAIQLADELQLQGGTLAEALLTPIKTREAAHEEAFALRQAGRTVQIFDYAKLASDEEKARAKSVNKDVRDQVLNARKNAMRYEGLRLLPSFAEALRNLRFTMKQFANFETVIEALDDELTLAEHMPPSQFGVRPILMNGVPGIGKTAFALHVAKTLGVPFEKVSAAGLQNGFVLCGSSKQWGNTSPGVVFNLLSESKYATAVLLIDEVDKLSTDDRYTTVPALLDLLEHESARHYKDESVDINFDASRMIVLMTSNSLGNVNKALLSRCEVFEIEEPTNEQRLNIMKRLVDQMNVGIEKEKQIELDEEAAIELASKQIDLRELIASTKAAYVKSIRDGSRIAKPFIKKGRERITFGFAPQN